MLSIMSRHITFVLLSLFVCTIGTKAQTKPNIIYILADDLGIGDLSIYNKIVKYILRISMNLVLKVWF